MSFSGNWVDLLILFLVLPFLWDGVRRGVILSFLELVVWLLSLLFAFFLYPKLAPLFENYFSIPTAFAKPLSFLLAGVFLGWFLSFLASFGVRRIPEYIFSFAGRRIFTAVLDRALGILISLFQGLALLTFIYAFAWATPINPTVKTALLESQTGKLLVPQAARFEGIIKNIFGEAIEQSLTFLTVKPDSGESITLEATPKTLTVDEKAEEEMLDLLNKERTSRGLHPLVVDPKIVAVARKHSKDMWERRYFSHINPDGETPADRMKKGGVDFMIAGENLALAPTTKTAHEGLMNSEGHKRNILDPSYGRIGIGGIDGGPYGKMFTQNFAD